MKQYGHVLNLAGGGWRLPTLTELESLIDNSVYPEGTDGTHINMTYFPNTHAISYASSTASANYTYDAWYVDFGSGHVGDGYKSFGSYVRCVR